MKNDFLVLHRAPVLKLRSTPVLDLQGMRFSNPAWKKELRKITKLFTLQEAELIFLASILIATAIIIVGNIRAHALIGW